MSIKRLISAVLTVATCMTVFSTTAFAQVKTMSDGTQFDAEYYAAQNPDVVAACGNNEIALFQHYVQFGKAEGRAPFANGTQTATASASSTTSSGVKMEAGDEGYLRAGYLSNWTGDYKLNDDQWHSDPAYGFVRGDYSADPTYQALKAEILQMVATKGNYIDEYSTSIYKGDVKYYIQLCNNLAVDLMKSGEVKGAYIFNNPADGQWHIGDPDYNEYRACIYVNNRYITYEKWNNHPEARPYFDAETKSLIKSHSSKIDPYN
jgi:hypothetical protein